MPNPTYILLNQVTLAAASSSITFSSIPQSYQDLVVVSSVATQNDAFRQYRIRINSDSGSNYNEIKLNGSGSATGSSAGTNGTEFTFFSTGANGVFSTMTTQFIDYSALDKHKTFLHRGSVPDQTIGVDGGRWANTAAINTLTIYTPAGQFVTGSTFYIYGLVA